MLDHATRCAGPAKATYLDKAGRVVAVKVTDDETLFRGELELVDACRQEFVGRGLLALLFRHLVLVDLEAHVGIEGIVDGHQGITLAECPPQQCDRVGVLVGRLLLLAQDFGEAGHGAQATRQCQANHEQRGLFVAALVDDIVGGLDGPAVGGRSRGGQGGRGEQGRGRGALGRVGRPRGIGREARMV